VFEQPAANEDDLDAGVIHQLQRDAGAVRHNGRLKVGRKMPRHLRRRRATIQHNHLPIPNQPRCRPTDGHFTPGDQATLLQFQSDLNAIVADGPESFDNADLTTLLFGTLDVVGILTNIDCDGFL
jgi:hypothetical protein